jgi:hypothetical protein
MALMGEKLYGQCAHCGGNLTVDHRCQIQCPGAQDAQEALTSMLAKPKRHKASHIGAPAVFLLEQACQHVNDAFDGFGCYLVGSAMERPDWRDVDVRLIMSDAEFCALFPGANVWPEGNGGTWEHDARWLLLTTAISAWLKQQTGLPVDFQFQPQNHANKTHDKPRNAVGMRIQKVGKEEPAP